MLAHRSSRGKGYMPQAIIFDIDGTLIDSVEFHALAWQEAFREFGHTFTLKSIRDQIGKGGDQLMPVFLSPAEIASKGKQLERRRADVFKARYLAEVKPFPGVRDLFIRLLRDGKQVALASSAKSDEMKIYEQIAEIADLLDAETSSEDAQKSKPHPDVFRAVLGRLGGVAAAQAIAVGDTPYDAEAAAKVGVRTIGVLCGGWSAGELKKAGAIAVYRDIADLLAQYASSPLVD